MNGRLKFEKEFLMKKFMLAFRTVIVVLLCAVVLLGLSACAGDDPAGTALDRFLWETRGFPTQDEILNSLQEKYGEEFVLVDLSSGNRFFQGVAYPAANPDLVFSLEMKDEDGNSMPIQYMRDDYQARLAEQYILQQIRPLIDREFGANKVDSLRVEIGLFDRAGGFNLPESFEWTPADGLEALAERDDTSVQLMIRVSLEAGADLGYLGYQGMTSLADMLVSSAEIPFSGSVSIVQADMEAQKLAEWTITNGELSDINVEILD